MCSGASTCLLQASGIGWQGRGRRAPTNRCVALAQRACTAQSGPHTLQEPLPPPRCSPRRSSPATCTETDGARRRRRRRRRRRHPARGRREEGGEGVRGVGARGRQLACLCRPNGEATAATRYYTDPSTAATPTARLRSPARRRRRRLPGRPRGARRPPAPPLATPASLHLAPPPPQPERGYSTGGWQAGGGWVAGRT